MKTPHGNKLRRAAARFLAMAVYVFIVFHIAASAFGVSAADTKNMSMTFILFGVVGVGPLVGYWWAKLHR